MNRIIACRYDLLGYFHEMEQLEQEIVPLTHPPANHGTNHSYCFLADLLNIITNTAYRSFPPSYQRQIAHIIDAYVHMYVNIVREFQMRHIIYL